jgi:hypothetical protein
MHLQLELSRFELLLSTHAPQLHQHLLDAGLPALLYAAQWLMTCYACPFPIHVAARVLDVLLQVCAGGRGALQTPCTSCMLHVGVERHALVIIAVAGCAWLPRTARVPDMMAIDVVVYGAS